MTMGYNPEDLARLKHLYEMGDQILDVTDDHETRIANLEAASASSILYATKAYWDRQLTFVPPRGALIIYADRTVENDVNIPGFKVGDGNAYVVDLPFSQQDLETAIRNHVNNSRIHLSEDDRSKLEDSVKTRIETQSGSSDYTLVFTKD